MSVNGQEIIAPTWFPDNAVTEIKLPKTNDIYKVQFYNQMTYTHSSPEMNPTGLFNEFKGNSSKEIKFTAGFLFGGDDEAIATAEFAVYIGDTALDIASAPFGGPIAGFVVSQVKGSVIDLITCALKEAP